MTRHSRCTFHAVRLALIMATIIVLVVMPVRVMMQPWIILFEYNRPGFPPDLFGMNRAERERLALVGVESIVGPRGMEALRQARLDDGRLAFTQREISHMQDVRNVTGNLYAAQVIALVWLAGAALVAYRKKSARPALASAVQTGALTTLAGVMGVGVFVAVAWNDFFTTFHRIFFEGDSWLFAYDDTLIRLYPVQFWIDVTVMICAALVVESLALAALLQLWRRRLDNQPQPLPHQERLADRCG